MLESIPVLFQVLLWPLLGAAVIWALGRMLPGWMRRLLGAAAAGLSLLTLWPLRGTTIERVEFTWEPLGLFRASPSLYADELALTAGILICGLALGLLLGLHGRKLGSIAWPAIVLLSLDGVLAMLMASNLLTLALGSALLDLALVGAILWASSDADREASPALVVPGIASTLLLVANALQLDVSIGHTSLLGRELPMSTVTLLGMAALLRLAPFPLYPRGLRQPQSAAVILLPTAAGIYLLARVEAMALGLWNPPWLQIPGFVALLAGGVLVWSGALAMDGQDGSPRWAGFWTGLLVHQVGHALLFWSVLDGAAPWPLVGLPLALGALAVCWQAAVAPRESLPAGRWRRIGQRLVPRRAELPRRAAARLRAISGWPGWRALTWLSPLLLVIVLASLAGAPFTAGARVRWPTYAALLRRASGWLLILLAADTFLVAGLGVALRRGLVQPGLWRLSPLSVLGAASLVLSLVVLALWPGSLTLRPARVSGVSIWGLGLIYVLPWLLGAWLARLQIPLGTFAAKVSSLFELGWLYRVLGGAGRLVVGFFFWLGQVGEGAGWWGWAMIILALGAILLSGQG